MLNIKKARSKFWNKLSKMGRLSYLYVRAIIKYEKNIKYDVRAMSMYYVLLLYEFSI